MSLTRILFAAVFLSLYLGTNFYVARRLYQWFHLLFPTMGLKLFISIFVFLTLSVILGYLPFPSPIRDTFSFVGLMWMGTFLYLLIFFALADMAVLVGWLTKIIPSPIPTPVHFYKGLSSLALTFIVVAYGLFNATQIRSVTYNIQFNDVTLNGFTIVMVSDLHLGGLNSESKIERMVSIINGMEPDIVCIVGDIFNDDFNLIRNPERAATLLRSIESTHGVFAVLGNHDGGSTLPQMMDFLTYSDITLLNDEHVIIDDRVALFGRLDASPIGGFGGLMRQDVSCMIKTLSLTYPVIVMDHNPSHINEYGPETALLLSGHTHRGQVFPGSLITRAMFTVDYGHYRKDQNSPHVIVTSGVNLWGPPMRIGTKNEVVQIIIH
jgi:hypothetical protein